MKIDNREILDYDLKIKSIENGLCMYCYGENIVNGICVDCMNKSDYLYLKDRTISKKDHTLELKFELSEIQKKASNFFLDKLMNKEDAFLYSVCGSGKTEIMYEPILKTLNEGLKVAFVIPRKEIVNELKERLEGCFKNTIIKAIDGNHHDDECDLLLSTVNQMIHYDKEFDLIILDEADAFPYYDSDFLKRVLRKALKPDGILFMMSATLKERPKCEMFTISRRYHKNDLKMPEFYRTVGDCFNSIDFNNLINKGTRKLIIYAYSIKRAREIAEKLECPFVSSKVESISYIKNEFKKNDSRFLVSTTILERGITIKGLDVCVLDAENKVFNHQTLIQICGRVGRSYEDPIGNIYIFYNRYSLKFLLVKNYIERMNKNEM